MSCVTFADFKTIAVTDTIKRGWTVLWDVKYAGNIETIPPFKEFLVEAKSPETRFEFRAATQGH